MIIKVHKFMEKNYKRINLDLLCYQWLIKPLKEFIRLQKSFQEWTRDTSRQKYIRQSKILAAAILSC